MTAGDGGPPAGDHRLRSAPTMARLDNWSRSQLQGWPLPDASEEGFPDYDFGLDAIFKRRTFCVVLQHARGWSHGGFLDWEEGVDFGLAMRLKRPTGRSNSAGP